MSLRGLATYHGDNPLLRRSIQQGRRAWPLLIIQRTIQSAILIAMADPAHSLRRKVKKLSDSRSRDSLAKLQKRQRPKDHANLLNTTS